MISATALIFGFFTSLGLFWSAWTSPSGERDAVVNAGLFSLAGAVAGGWLFYRFIHQAWFLAHPASLFSFPLAGFSWPGALLGSLLFLSLFAYFGRIPLLNLAGSLTPLFVLLAIASWQGCRLSGCAYGPISASPLSLPAVDEWGVAARRLPLQHFASLAILSVSFIIDRIIHRPSGSFFPHAARFPVTLAAILLFQFFLSAFRVDPAPLWRGMRLDGWFALVMSALLFIFSLLILLFPARRPGAPQQSPRME